MPEPHAPPRAHILLAHPEPKSFNGQLALLSQKTLGAVGYDTTLSDLYAMGFDPREGPHHYSSRQDAVVFHAQSEQRSSADHGTTASDIDAEARHLENSDLLVVHFPLWWFGMPAMLKGWMDRVFIYGRMYRSTVRYDTGVCAGKQMIACVTTGAREESCSHSGREGDTLLHLWPILFAFRYLGFEVLQPEVLHGVGGVAFIEENVGELSTLDTYTERWATSLKNLHSRPVVPYNRDTDFDESKRLVPGAPEYSPFIRHAADAVRLSTEPSPTDP